MKADSRTGHVHDRGAETAIFLNRKEVCVSKQLYGTKLDYTSPDGSHDCGDGHGDGHDGQKHICSVEMCKEFGTVVDGDMLQVVARHNTTKYPLMPEQMAMGIIPSWIFLGL